MNILKEEINQSNCDVISLAKWKLAVVSAVIVVSLGWIDTTSEWSVPSEAGLILIYSVGLVCGYVDWLIYRRYTVIHTIAKYIRTYSGEDPDTLELQKYEIHMNDTRTNNEFFLSDRYTHCLLYTSPSPRDKRQSRMPSSA